MSPLFKLACAAVLMVAASSALAAQPAESIDPEKTYEALTILLASHSARVPAHSSCDGMFAQGQKGPAKIGDVFAYRLAYLSDGKNVVSGHCNNKRALRDCVISMTHAEGEDVASTTIRFRVVNGKLAPASLACVITP